MRPFQLESVTAHQLRIANLSYLDIPLRTKAGLLVTPSAKKSKTQGKNLSQVFKDKTQH